MMRVHGINKPAGQLGAICGEDDGTDRFGRRQCYVLVWAPFAERVDLYMSAPDEKTLPMIDLMDGYFSLTMEGVIPGSLYQFRLFLRDVDDRQQGPLLRADPASRLQPQGVHGPSQIVTEDFTWNDMGWNGPALTNYIIYEMHVGTATPEGTFEAIIPMLPELQELGITALELMPVAEFPGERNWGYDGVYPFAAHHAYGGPEGLKRLVDACHRTGLAVIMDVVYNHLGPEGNYLNDFGPYFTDTYKTPWGRAVNFDGRFSDHVRRYFIENARYWIRNCHVDALRVDAVHGIYDFSAQPFLSELTRLVADEARRQKRRIYCIAESDLNDTKIIRPRSAGGMAFDAQWNDDFHHALHTLLTGEQDGYYTDFGRLDDLKNAWKRGYVYNGRYSSARKRRHGNDASKEPAEKFIIFSQNHDQVGNRMRGERLSRLVDYAQVKLAAACVLFSPYIPLLFMGEEYAEKASFPYFISHGDPDLVEAVRRGRQNEFKAFRWNGQPPDPQAVETFEQAKINPSLKRAEGLHNSTYAFYRELIRLRKTLPALSHLHRHRMQIDSFASEKLLQIQRCHGRNEVRMYFHFSDRASNHDDHTTSESRWRKLLDTADARWLGPGSHAPDVLEGGKIHLSPWQMILYEKDNPPHTAV